MTSTIEVSSLEAARAELTRIRDSRGKIIFRGQRDHLWKIQSSLSRLQDERTATVHDALRRLGEWAADTKALEDFGMDELLAIAQHYGIPTHLIDWSRSVEAALFFACDGAEVGAKSRVFFLDLEEWERFWLVARKANVPSELADYPHWMKIIDLHIPDLWRLTRQEGLFIEIPIEGLEYFYPIDSVVFTQSTASVQWAKEKRAYFYPDQRSPLEERLFEFFMHERSLANQATQEWAELMSKVTVSRITRSYSEETTTPDAILAGVDAAWTKLPDEDTQRTSETQFIRVSPDTSIVDTFADLTAFISEVEALLSECDRNRPLSIVNQATSTWGDVVAPLLGKIEAAWNGMRWLPYSDAEIVGVISRVIGRVCIPEDCLCHVPSEKHRNLEAIERYAQQVDGKLPGTDGLRSERHSYLTDSCRVRAFRDAYGHQWVAPRPHHDSRLNLQELEFGSSSSGAYQRGWVDSDCLEVGMTPEARETVIFWALLLIEQRWHPLRVFEFEGLRHEWVHSILPSQIAFRAGRQSGSPAGWNHAVSPGGRINPVFYSPAWIDQMGLP